MALTPKQAKFVEEYLLDGNGRRAAIAAGYSERTAHVIANENLNKPYIAELIEKGQKRVIDQVVAKREITRERLMDMAEKVFEEAFKVGQLAAANGAIKELGILSGERVEKRETTSVPHEERLAAIRERVNDGQRPTTH
jgi:phage terminase small subunit